MLWLVLGALVHSYRTAYIPPLSLLHASHALEAFWLLLFASIATVKIITCGAEVLFSFQTQVKTIHNQPSAKLTRAAKPSDYRIEARRAIVTVDCG